MQEQDWLCFHHTWITGNAIKLHNVPLICLTFQTPNYVPQRSTFIISVNDSPSDSQSDSQKSFTRAVKKPPLRGSTRGGERSERLVSKGDVCRILSKQHITHADTYWFWIAPVVIFFPKNNRSMCRGNTHAHSGRMAASSEMSKATHSDNKCLRKQALCLLFLPVSVRKIPQGYASKMKTSKRKAVIRASQLYVSSLYINKSTACLPFAPTFPECSLLVFY